MGRCKRYTQLKFGTVPLDTGLMVTLHIVLHVYFDTHGSFFYKEVNNHLRPQTPAAHWKCALLALRVVGKKEIKGRKGK